ncbi:hypothetical protein EV182_004119 [Spiromyces aspiralis]|uniref:Uncharacterized protein n=1 Tax=Spiromyces aspiralis TaxID=68401 RepID=A0ACC1HPD2_9FUNG|nr:hypothetical protein EV182_004119 [Spiromyces aspiralis]
MVAFYESQESLARIIGGKNANNDFRPTDEQAVGVAPPSLPSLEVNTHHPRVLPDPGSPTMAAIRCRGISLSPVIVNRPNSGKRQLSTHTNAHSMVVSSNTDLALDKCKTSIDAREERWDDTRDSLSESGICAGESAGDGDGGVRSNEREGSDKSAESDKHSLYAVGVADAQVVDGSNPLPKGDSNSGDPGNGDDNTERPSMGSSSSLSGGSTTKELRTAPVSSATISNGKQTMANAFYNHSNGPHGEHHIKSSDTIRIGGDHCEAGDNDIVA